MMPTALPANLVYFRPRTERRTPGAARASRQAMVERGQLLDRLATIGELAPEAPLSLLVVQVRGLTRLGERADAPASERVLKAAGQRIRELTRVTDSVGRFSGSTIAVVLQGTGATAASATAARLTFHLNQLLAGFSPCLDAAVYAATGVGANADMLPVVALDSLEECC